MVHDQLRLAATSSRHIGLICSVIIARSSCALSLEIAAEIGVMPSTVASNRSPPIAVWAFIPIGAPTA
jgi:hypothetical protein